MERKKLFILGLLLFLSVNLVAQYDRLPQEYYSPDQLISMNSNLEISMALELLSEYAIKFREKPIYDPTSATGPIGVDIVQLPWEKALQSILSRRGLWFREREHFLEIVKAPQQAVEDASVLEIPGGQITIEPGDREIKIETIFFLGNRNDLRQIGIDWSSFYRGKVNVDAEALGAFQANEEFLNLSVVIPGKTYNVDLSALLTIFDSYNMGTILAQPQVVVTEGNLGKVQVGQDFSIKTRDYAGNVMDRFFNTGTILEVTPFILKDKDGNNSIVLQARVERSQATPNVVSTIIDKSEATSLVQLYDGEETLIAGLYSTEMLTIRKGVPVLKDLPWWFLGLRYIFGFEQLQADEKELLIIIKATILPNVFARKNDPNYVKSRMSDPVRAIEPFRYKDYTHLLPRLRVREKYRASESPYYQNQRQTTPEPTTQRYAPQTQYTPHPPVQQPVRSQPEQEPYYQESFDSGLATFEEEPAQDTQTTTFAPEPEQSEPESPLFEPYEEPTQDTSEEQPLFESFVEEPAQEVVTEPLFTPEPPQRSTTLQGDEFSAQSQIENETGQNVFVGKIQYIQNKVALVAWNDITDTSLLIGRTAKVFRKNLFNYFDEVTEVSILNGKRNKTVVSEIDDSGDGFEVGDIVAIAISE